MDQDLIARSQFEARTGIAAFERDQREDAGLHFWNALAALDEVRETTARRRELSDLAFLFYQAGFDDLSLMAVLDAIELGEQLGDERGLAGDRMTYANVHTRLENREEAESAFRAILKSCLRRSDFANAASASTNLAALLANDGYRPEAIALLENSLDYLEREAFPDTEINTRLTLIQVLEFEEANPERIFEVTRPLLENYLDLLAPVHLNVIRQFIDRAVERHVQSRPGIDAEAWKRQAFPVIYGI